MALPLHTRARPDLNRARRKLTRQAGLRREARPGSRLQGAKVRLRVAEQSLMFEVGESWDWLELRFPHSYLESFPVPIL